MEGIIDRECNQNINIPLAELVNRYFRVPDNSYHSKQITNPQKVNMMSNTPQNATNLYIPVYREKSSGEQFQIHQQVPYNRFNPIFQSRPPTVFRSNGRAPARGRFYPRGRQAGRSLGARNFNIRQYQRTQASDPYQSITRPPIACNSCGALGYTIFTCPNCSMRIPQSKPLINNVSVPNDTYEQSPDIDPNVITLIDDGTNQDFNGYQEEEVYYENEEYVDEDSYNNEFHVNMIQQIVPNAINNFNLSSTDATTDTTSAPPLAGLKRSLANSESVLADSGANSIVLNRLPDGVTNSRISRASILFANNTRLPVSTEATMGTIPISVSSELRENVISLGKLADNNYVSIIDKNNILFTLQLYCPTSTSR